MKGVILAAGIASRLRPLTETTPKCLLRVGDPTILGRTLQNLRQNDIREIVMVTGYLEEQIHAFVRGKFPNLHVQFLTNPLYDSTNNIYSLWLARDYVLNDDMLLLDSDIIFDQSIITLLVESGHHNCLAMKSGIPLGEEEIKVLTDKTGRILEISKVVDPKKAAGESIGIEKFSAEYVSTLFGILKEKMIVRKEANHFYEAAFQESIAKGSMIYAVDVQDRSCMEIDTAEDIHRAAALFAGS